MPNAKPNLISTIPICPKDWLSVPDHDIPQSTFSHIVAVWNLDIIFANVPLSLPFTHWSYVCWYYLGVSMAQIHAIPPPLFFICLLPSDYLEKVIYDWKYATWCVEDLYGKRCDFFMLLDALRICMAKDVILLCYLMRWGSVWQKLWFGYLCFRM